MKTSKKSFAIIFSLLIFAFSFFETANGQSLQNVLPNLNKFRAPVAPQTLPDQVYTPDLQRDFNNLIEKAREKGTVRIIVGFKLENYRPDAELDQSKQIKQRSDIKKKQSSLLDRLNNFNVAEVKQFDYIPFLAMEVSADALAALRESPDVNFIKEDELHKPMLPQSIPIIGANTAAAGGWTGTGWTVAILDSGVDKTHPFFNNRVVSEACYGTNGMGMTSACPGGVTASTAPGSGLHCNVSQVDNCTHGTHVAGIASGGNPNITGWGVARNSNIIAIQVFSYSSDCGSETPPCVRTSESDWSRGLERVYALRTTYNIAAANMSLGGGQFTANCDAQNALGKAAIDNLRSANIATIIASGNSGYTNAMGSPGCISTAISVGSTNDGDVLPIDFVSDFSNSAYFLHLLAPGEVILSSIPGGNYDDSQGTSMAAPMVAGAWAVMKQRYPTDTVAQTLTRLRYSGVQVLDSRNGLVKPRIKLDTALNTSNVDPCNSTSPISFGQTINASLSSTDCLLWAYGNRADIYTFTGTAGQGVSIAQNTSAFFAYLYLFDANGNIVGQNSVGGGGMNARIPAGSGFVTLPSTGTYYIYATSLEGNKFGNYTLNVSSNGPSCSFTITSSSQAFSSAGGSGNFGVNTAAGCAWTAQSNSGWLTTTSSGNGNGTVNYTVAANTSAAQRVGTITAGGQVHTVTQAGASTTTTRRPFDYDGDGKTDLSIFRPSNGQWWYYRSSDGGNYAATFGVSTDKLVPGDFTGDGKTDIAIWRPSTGEWFVLRSENSSFYSFPFGTNGDIPAPADFDADGKSDAAVFRPSTNTWYINKSAGGTDILTFGSAGDKPVPADYDGDGKADVAIWRPSVGQWWILRSVLGTIAYTFGNSADIPVRGDYTGDGKTDVAVWRPSTGEWFILRSENSSYYSFPFGTNGDKPTPGDYDGDGRFDAAVFRPSGSTWYVQRSTAGTLIQTFGSGGDIPTPNAFVP